MDRGWLHGTGGRGQDHPQEKEMQKGKNGCLRRPYKEEKRREVKGKWEKERYTRLNADSKEQQGERRKPS